MLQDNVEQFQNIEILQLTSSSALTNEATAICYHFLALLFTKNDTNCPKCYMQFVTTSLTPGQLSRLLHTAAIPVSGALAPVLLLLLGQLATA